MGTKPNWGRGIGMGLSALGRGMFASGMQKRRQDFMSEERRLREAQRKLEAQLRSDQTDARQQTAIDAEQARYERDNPLSFPGGIDMPFGTNMPSDMRLSEEIKRFHVDKLRNPPPADPKSTVTVTGGDGMPYELTQHQAYKTTLPDEESDIDRLVDSLAVRSADEQRKHERNREEKIGDDALRRENKLADAMSVAQVKEIDSAGDAIYEDVMSRIHPEYSSWKPTDEFGVYSRRTEDSAPFNPFSGGEVDETTSLAIEANKVISHMLADGVIDKVEHGKIRDAAGKLNISPNEMMALWDPALQTMWKELEASLIIEEMNR